MSAAASFDIDQDPNFKLLAACKTSVDEFQRLLATHVPGYTQKKRVVDRLKPLVASLEAIETKVIIRASVGKGKTILDYAEQCLHDNHSVHDVKEKVKILNADLQATLEEGRVTSDERQLVLEDLQQRLEAAEQAGKEKLKEKLERGIAGVSNAGPYALPMPDAMELDTLKKKLRVISGLEKKAWNDLTEYEQRKLAEKPDITQAIKDIEKSNRMWFETEQEFKQRLEYALLNATSLKLEQKRLAAKDQPQKPVPQPKKKEKKKGIKLDNRELFAHLVDDEPEEAEEKDAAEATTDEPAHADSMVSPSESPPASPAPAPATASQEPPLQEDKAPTLPAATSPEREEAGRDELCAVPAQAEKPKKVPGPAPKKREKKKYTKLDASALGFELA